MPSMSRSHWRPMTSRRSSATSRPPSTSGSGRRSHLRLQRPVRRERLGRAVAGPVPGERRVADVQLREERRAGVVAAELVELPLAREHPQRVAHLGAQRPVERLRARAPLEAVPHRDRREAAARAARRGCRGPRSAQPSAISVEGVVVAREHGPDRDAAQRGGNDRGGQEPRVGGRVDLRGLDRALLGEVERLVQRARQVVPPPRPVRRRGRDEQQGLRRLGVRAVVVAARSPSTASSPGMTSVHSSSSRRALGCAGLQGPGEVGGVEQVVALDGAAVREPQGEPVVVGDVRQLERDELGLGTPEAAGEHDDLPPTRRSCSRTRAAP